MVFYRKYRPQNLKDLVGQEAIAHNLLSQLEGGSFSHGYLFYGPKGTGKTSTARIFAKAVNCQKSEVGSRKSDISEIRNLKAGIRFGEPCNKCVSCISITNGSNLDVLEIDAASNRGIDEIRDLREKIKLSPVSARFKVYIVDEAHMLTTEAFNALLKTLEEPPAHAIFILCTTEVGKLPETIVSRLQKFNFSRAKVDDLEKVILQIAKVEKIKIEKGAAVEIAESSDGSFRDAVSILDQLASEKNVIKSADVFSVARVGGFDIIFKFTEYLSSKDLKGAVVFIEDLAADGADISYFARQVVLFLEKLLFVKIGVLESEIDDYSKDQVEKMKTLASEFTSADLQNLMKRFLVAEGEIKQYPLPQIPLVLATCWYIPEVGSQKSEVGSQELENRVNRIELRGQEVKKDETVNMVKDDSKDESEGKTDKNLKLEKTKQVNVKRNGSMKQIEKNWDNFTSRVKPVNAHVVALLKSARLLNFDGSTLTLEVFYRFHKEKLEDIKIIKMLEDVMSDLLKKHVRFKFILASSHSKPPRIVSKSNVVEISSKDLAQMTQEIFSK